MKKSIFVSRSLVETSPIRAVCQNQNLTDESLILFDPLAFDQPICEWVFFYSGNGVKYFFEDGPYELVPYQYACMSHGTASVLRQYVQDVSFIGEGNPKDVAKQYAGFVPEYKVTAYIRAQNSRDSVRKLLDRPLDFSIPVYSNTPRKYVPNTQFDILVFTSPLNAEAYFAHNLYNNETVIAIGSTTEQYLNSLNIKSKVANTPSEQGICDILLECLKKND